MPATVARIAFVSEATRNSVAQDAAIKTRYGTAARDTLDQPAESFFDTAADVQAMVDERFALLKGDRRRFDVSVSGLLTFTGALDFSQVAPTVTLIDDEKAASMTAIITGIPGKDYEAETTSLSIWG